MSAPQTDRSRSCALVAQLRVGVRMCRLVLHVIKGLIYATLFLGGVEHGEPSKRQQKIIQCWLTQLGKVIGIETTVYDTGEKNRGPVLVVANHMAWTDILVIATCLPASFLSHAGVRTWPVGGFLARRSGTLFIERGAQGAVTQARNTVGKHLQRGRTVAVFPGGCDRATLARLAHESITQQLAQRAPEHASMSLRLSTLT